MNSPRAQAPVDVFPTLESVVVLFTHFLDHWMLAPSELRGVNMAKLTTQARKKLPSDKFALPGGRYPVEDKAHARDAKARASQQRNAGRLSAADKAKVDRKADAVLGKKGK
jgi:hypothetical protein